VGNEEGGWREGGEVDGRVWIRYRGVESEWIAELEHFLKYVITQNGF
jgi:hypothetical protein